MLGLLYTSIFYTRVAMEVGFHRFFAHKSFETTAFKRRLLLLMGSSTGVGSCISWVGVHRTHHRYSDTERDPHSPRHIGLLRVWFTFWGNNWVVDPSTVKDLMRDPWQMFLHRNYFKVLIAWLLFLSGVSYLLGSMLPIIILYALPCTFMIMITGLYTNGLGHMSGYRNFETDDYSHNHHHVRWLLLTAGLHNNHHARPNAWNLNINNNWREFDVEGIIIKHFFKN